MSAIVGTPEWSREAHAECKRLDFEYARIEARNNRWFLGADCNDPITTENLLAAEHPGLSQRQRDVLVAKLNEAVDEPTMRTKGWLRRNLDKLIEGDAAMVTPIPSVQELFSALGYGALPAQERIEKFRGLERLSEDERLALLPEKKAAAIDEKEVEPEKPAAPVELTDDQADDLIAERLGFTTRHAMRAATMSVKVRAYRDAVRKDAAKPVARAAPSTAPSAGIDTTTEEFKRLSPQQRINKFRAASGG